VYILVLCLRLLFIVHQCRAKFLAKKYFRPISGEGQSPLSAPRIDAVGQRQLNFMCHVMRRDSLQNSVVTGIVCVGWVPNTFFAYCILAVRGYTRAMYLEWTDFSSSVCWKDNVSPCITAHRATEDRVL